MIIFPAHCITVKRRTYERKRRHCGKKPNRPNQFLFFFFLFFRFFCCCCAVCSVSRKPSRRQKTKQIKARYKSRTCFRLLITHSSITQRNTKGRADESDSKQNCNVLGGHFAFSLDHILLFCYGKK